MLEALKESLSAIRDCVDASRMREKRRFYELWNQPREVLERDDIAFHYFYAGRIFSIVRQGLLSKDELNRRGWSDAQIKPTEMLKPPIHNSQIWFTNVDYITAVHMPPFMRHPRNGDLWGLGPARIVVNQAGLSLRVDLTACAMARQEPPRDGVITGKWLTWDGPEVPPSSFIRVDYYDLYSGEWFVFPHKT